MKSGGKYIILILGHDIYKSHILDSNQPLVEAFFFFAVVSCAAQLKSAASLAPLFFTLQNHQKQIRWLPYSLQKEITGPNDQPSLQPVLSINRVFSLFGLHITFILCQPCHDRSLWVVTSRTSGISTQHVSQWCSWLGKKFERSNTLDNTMLSHFQRTTTQLSLLKPTQMSKLSAAPYLPVLTHLVSSPFLHVSFLKFKQATT